MIVHFFEREPKSFFLVIEDLDMKGTASTSGPFFSVSWARKGWEQQERDLTVPPHPWAPAEDTDGVKRTWQDGLQKEGNKQTKITGIQRKEKCCPKSKSVYSQGKRRLQAARDSCGALKNSQTQPVGQETEECAARSESSTGTSSPKDTTEALNGRLYLWLETSPATK